MNRTGFIRLVRTIDGKNLPNFALIRNSGMVFEKGLSPIIKSLMYLDGMVLRCNPDAVLMKVMKRFIGEFRRVMGQRRGPSPLSISRI